MYPGRRPLVAGRWWALLLGLGAVAPAAAQEPAVTRVQFGFGYPGFQPADPAAGFASRYGVRPPPAMIGAAWRAGIDARLAERRAERRMALLLGTTAALAGPEPTAIPPGPAFVPPPPLPAAGRLVDLNLELNARVETQVDQLRNLNCSVAEATNLAAGCQTPFPTPVLGEEFAIRAGGVIADRLHLNVDFDGQREFSAENAINIWYQGDEDEILQRVEVGNIDFRLPRSRFITSAIPANSFGMQADAQLGPVQIRGILAQQKGSSVRTRTFSVGDRAAQNIEREQLDLEFETGRFFFTVNPFALPGYPDVDVLNLSPVAVPATQQPVDVRVYRLRAQSGAVSISPNLGGIDAVAVRFDSPQRVGPFPWQLLIEGVDYYLDPSAMWFALRNRIGNDEYLAVSYVTAAGDTVGTFPAINGTVDTLELVHEPLRGDDVPTYFYEMRNAYRIGTNLSRGSVDLRIHVNDSDRPLNGQGTYLERLGVAQASDPNRLDEYNRVFPRERDPNDGAPLRDAFLIFPHLTPLAQPFDLLPDERNDSLYTTPAYLLATEGPVPRFTFSWRYEASGSDDRSQVSLGALQVRDGSERLFVGERELVRGVDYNISYDLGVVTFTDPDALFAGPTQVRVQFEEHQLFDVAPKNVFGVAGTYRLGARSRIDAIGLLQRERSIFTRPGLGFEPQAMFMGGLSGEFEFRLDGVTRALDDLPFMSTDVPSRFEVSGEIAVSRPNPNQEGEAYVEEFEGEAARRITLLQNEFQLGSQPRSVHGVDATRYSASGTFDPDDAVPLIWQNAIEVNGGPFEVSAQQIDSSIVTTGTSRLAETLLWMTLKHDSVGGAPDAMGNPRWLQTPNGGPRWRSITRPLDRSGLGVDLSRTEFLEFWLLEDFGLTARQQGAHLIFDFGGVAEDAVAFGPDGFSVVGQDTVFTGRQRLGEGQLDSEKDPLTNSFNAAIHDIGIHGDNVPTLMDNTNGGVARNVPLCEQGFTVGLPVFPLGSLNARCTRRNGLVDSEDLNGDNRLDEEIGPVQEHVVRHVIPIGDAKYVARTGATLPDVGGRPMTWRLYRIPFRQDTFQIGAPNLRRVQAMRITVATPDRGAMEQEFSVAFARMRLVGAPWVKRAATPLVGLGGAATVPRGEVIASVVSTDNEDLGYTSPPGVRDAAARLGASLEPGQQEINERSLRLIANDLQPDERAEAYIRYGDQSNKNFLKYRLLRVWARGRGAGWLEEDLEFFIKVGRDEHNFYMYRTTVSAEDWLPEVVVELDRWLALRNEVQRRWLNGNPPSGSVECAGGDPTAYVACDGQYLIQVRDPGVAPPNLASVSEVAVGMYRRRQTVFAAESELWVDDIRLSDVVDDVGIASALDARFTAADFAEVVLSMDSQDDRFRQLDDDPDYRGDATIRVAATLRADKVLPADWGMNIPVTIQRRFTETDPFFVQGSDVESRALNNFRTPGSTSTSMQVAIRRERRGETAVVRHVVDPLTLVASRDVADNVTELSRSDVSDQRIRLDYNNRPAAVTTNGAPNFVRSMVNGLPDWIRNSQFGQAIQTSRLRVSPQQVRVSSSLTDYHADRNIFRVPVGLAGDSSRIALGSDIQVWRNDVGVELRPYSSLGARVDYTTVRDLQDYGDSTTVGRLTGREARTLAGIHTGFERERRLETSLSFSPVINSWLRPNLNLATQFGMYRDPNARSPVLVTTPGAGGFRLPEAVRNFARRELGTAVDLARLAQAVGAGETAIGRILARVLPGDVRHRRTRGSSFDRAEFSANLGYHLGMGSIDQFRFRGGMPANTAYETGEWTVAGGAQLPLGFLVRANFRDLNASSWIRRGTEQSRLRQSTREWPSAALTWVYAPRWALSRAVSTVTAQGQYRKTDGLTRHDRGGGGVFAEQDRRTMNPSLSVTWANGVVTSARLSRVRSDIITGGNLTRTDDNSWGGTLTFSVRSPTWLATLPSDVRATVAVNGRDEVICLRRADLGACAPVSDTRRRQIDIRLNTAFPPNMRGGANFSYVLTEHRHTSNRFGHLTLSVYVDINFLSSQIR